LRQKFEAQGVNVFFIGALPQPRPRCVPLLIVENARSLPAGTENICDREDIVEANIRSVKISSPDVR